MSSRALRRATATKDEFDMAELGDSETDLRTEQSERKNLFSLLQGDEVEAESEEEANKVNIEERVPVEEEEKIKKKTKGRKKERKNKDFKVSGCANLEGDTFIDEKEAETEAETETETETEKDSFEKIIKIDSNWLDPNFELKRKFGSTGGGGGVMETLDRASFNGQRRGAAVRRKALKRKDGLVTPRSSWQPFAPKDTGLLMVNIYGTNDYKIVEDDQYNKNFEELMLLVNSGDYSMLVQFVQKEPLFVDGLLLLSDAYRMQSIGDASEITERALYILERIFPSKFSLVDSDRRLPYSTVENRKFHLALFRYIQFTIKKSCWKVAFQLAKILLSLDPHIDPLACRLFLDFLALQADALDEFETLHNSFSRLYPTGPLPNWMFSASLCAFFKESDNVIKFEQQLSNSFLQSHPVSSGLLIKAIEQCPLVVPLLAEKCNFALPQGWLEKYREIQQKFDDELELLAIAKIFVSLNHPIWKAIKVQRWFEKTLDHNFSLANPVSLRPLTPSLRIPFYRHSIMSDLPGLNIAIPQQFTAVSSINTYDPLSPNDFDDQAPSILNRLTDLLHGLFNRALNFG